jgi:hypothetical protein
MADPILPKLYIDRALSRRFFGREKQREAHVAAVRRHEQTRGAQMVRVRRCPTCFLLHAIAVHGCDRNGKFLFEIWAIHGVDQVFVEDSTL